jgi:hypothetical protein
MAVLFQTVKQDLVTDVAANLIFDAFGRHVPDSILKLTRVVVVVGVPIGITVLRIKR